MRQQLYHRREAADTSTEPLPFSEHPSEHRDRAEDLLCDPFREALAEYLAEVAAPDRPADLMNVA